MAWESDGIAGTGGTDCGGLFLVRRFGGSSPVVPAESAHRGPSTMTSSGLWANNALAWDKRNGRCWTLHCRQDSIKEPIRVNAPVERHIL
jgi:hypothetical protein